LRDQFPESLEVVCVQATDDAVLTQSVYEINSGWVPFSQEPDEMAEHPAVDPVIVDLTIDVDRLAIELKSKPGLRERDKPGAANSHPGNRLALTRTTLK
jgi:hypothetical protein